MFVLRAFVGTIENLKHFSAPKHELLGGPYFEEGYLYEFVVKFSNNLH